MIFEYDYRAPELASVIDIGPPLPEVGWRVVVKFAEDSPDYDGFILNVNANEGDQPGSFALLIEIPDGTPSLDLLISTLRDGDDVYVKVVSPVVARSS